MSFLGLGSFGTGFVTGLAESADKALKDDISRINTRIDELAKIKFNRALDDQEERKKEVREAEEVLREAGAVFGDDPYAADYAAGLLKQSGSIQAFREEIAKLREAKKGNVPLAQFIKRASIDSPTGTFKDYAEAYVGSRRTLPDMKIAEDTTTAGTLVGSILGKKVDISGRAEKRVSEQMSAAGFTTPKAEGPFVAPVLEFDREGISMYQMSPSQRITYIQEELARTGLTDERKTQLQGFLNDNLIAAQKTGNNETQVAALKTQLSYASEEEKEGIKKQIIAVQREIEVDSALNEKARILVLANHAEEDGRTDEARSLKRQAEDMTSEPTLNIIYDRQSEDLQVEIAKFMRTNGKEGLNPEDEAVKKKVKQLETLKNTIDNVTGANNLDLADLNNADKSINSRLKMLMKSLVTEKPELFKIDIYGEPVFIENLQGELLQEALSLEKKLRTDSINDLIKSTTSIKEKKALEFQKNFLLQQGLVNPDPTEDTDKPVDTGEVFKVGDITIPNSVINNIVTTTGTDIQTVRKGIKAIINTYSPNSLDDAVKFGQEKNQMARIDDAELLGIYSAEWIAKAREAFNKKTTQLPEVSTDVQKGIDAFKDRGSIPFAMVDKLRFLKDVFPDKTEAQIKELLPEIQKGFNPTSQKSVEEKRPDELLKDIKFSITNNLKDGYETAIQNYLKFAPRGLSEEKLREKYPFPTDAAQGGLMSRR